jgi:SAM-dependent methyltransferase
VLQAFRGRRAAPGTGEAASSNACDNISKVAIHPIALRGFSSAAAAYERGRPDYPAEGISWLVRRLGIGPRTTVVDLAAGTGKLTRMLTPTRARVVAVEPVESMRSILADAVPAAEVTAGSAEEMPLPADFAAVVTVAQAFHWFDTERALQEVHRVLAPGGVLALVWNRRDLSQPVQQELHRIMARYRGTGPSYYRSAWREALARSRLFEPLPEPTTGPGVAAEGAVLEPKTFGHSQHLDAAGVIDRVMSVSFIATLPAERREELVRELRGLLRLLPETVELRYLTEIYLAARA